MELSNNLFSHFSPHKHKLSTDTRKQLTYFNHLCLLSSFSVCLSLQNAKPFSSSDSLAKVQEVASWLLEMNQDLLSGGSSSRRSRGPGGPAVRGNASSTARAPQQAAEEGDEDEHMNRVVEEEEQLQQRVRPTDIQLMIL